MTPRGNFCAHGRDVEFKVACLNIGHEVFGELYQFQQVQFEPIKLVLSNPLLDAIVSLYKFSASSPHLDQW